MSTQNAKASSLVLASASPRRRELIRALDMSVRLADPDTDEGKPLSGESPDTFVRRLSTDKARQVASETTDALVLAADTVVVLDGSVLGKPADRSEAARMLSGLRDRAHTVVTGLTLIDVPSGRRRSTTRATDVTMRDYSSEEVAAYVASGEPMDKAGGYAVQDRAFRPARGIEGCYLNVVGLPLCDVVDLLEGFGVAATLRADWHPPNECRDCPLQTRLEVGRT